MSQLPNNEAGVRENDFPLKSNLVDTDRIRLTTANENYNMTVGQFKDLIGYSALLQRTQVLEEHSSEATTLNVQSSSLNSTDRTGWNNQRSGLYYMGGTELGYPSTYGAVFHIHTGGSLIMQIFISRGQFAYRAFNQSQTMEWKVVT